MDLLKELLEFLDELKQYREILTNPDSKILAAKRKNELFAVFPFLQESFPKKSKEEVKEQIREGLIRKSSALKRNIIKLTGKQTFAKGMRKYDMWDAAFNPLFRVQNASLIFCMDAVNEAIGKLESDIANGLRDEQGEFIEEKHSTIEIAPESIFRINPPQAFISHGKESVALRKLKEFIETLGIEPLIVKKLPSEDKDLSDKVNTYLTQADFVIILATGDDIVGNQKQPRQNVIHEIGLAQKIHPGRIIYLLEEGTIFPSNIRPKVWESFKQRNMMDAFLGIVRELRAYGILEVTKFPIKEQPLDGKTI